MAQHWGRRHDFSRLLLFGYFPQNRRLWALIRRLRRDRRRLPLLLHSIERGAHALSLVELEQALVIILHLLQLV